MSCSQRAKYLGWISILNPFPAEALVWRCLARAPRLKGKPLEFHRVFGILQWVTSWSPHGPSETSPGNELLNRGQLARTCLEPHWPTEEGRVLLSGLPCLKRFPCSISNVLPLPFLSSSPFSHPRAEIRLERLDLPGRRARCGAGVLRSRDLEKCTVQRKEFP